VPDIAAPGVNVLSSVPGGGYDDTFSGTSMSSPHQAGAVVLMLAAAGGDVPRETLVGALEDTASKPDNWDVPDDEPDTRYGLGVIDVAAAMALVALDTGVEGATVEVGGSTVETGAFSRPLEPDDYDLTVSGFGIQETTVTVTVEDGDSFTDIGVVAVALSVGTDQPTSIEGGSDVPVTIEAANVDTLTVAATGDYDTAIADLFVDG
jgi:subtilisin family serine protease